MNSYLRQCSILKMEGETGHIVITLEGMEIIYFCFDARIFHQT